MHMTSTPSNTSYLSRPGGHIGYDVAGTGPLVVLVPGMGDLRASYRFLAPALREAGYRVACTDLRGHGDSDTTFASYGDDRRLGHRRRGGHRPDPRGKAAHLVGRGRGGVLDRDGAFPGL